MTALAGSLSFSGVERLLGDLRIQAGDDLIFAGQNGDPFGELNVGDPDLVAFR